MYVDLHSHSYPRSGDSNLSPDELVVAAKDRGLDALCLTEHDYFWDRASVDALSRRHDFLVLPGCEVNTDDGHVLVFGLEEYVFGMHHAAFLHRLVEQAGGVMVAAHPYRRRFLRERAGDPEAYSSMVERACADGFFAFCHAAEVLNGRALEADNRFSLDVAARLRLGMAGGSDSHRFVDMGKAATRFHRRISALDDLITEIKGGRFEPAVPDGNGHGSGHSPQISITRPSSRPVGTSKGRLSPPAESFTRLVTDTNK